MTEIRLTRSQGGSGRDRGIYLVQTHDGGYASVGYTDSLGAGQEDVYLVRLDAEGKILWSKTYGGSRKDNGWAIEENESGEFTILGFTLSLGAGELDMYLIRTEAEGNPL